MKRLSLTVLLLLLATSCFAGFGMQIVDGPVVASAPVCSSQTTVTILGTNDDHSEILYDEGYQVGQSFSAAESVTLYSIIVRLDSKEGTPVLTARIGTSADLSTYTGQTDAKNVTESVGSEVELVFPAESRPTITSGITYYVGVSNSATYDNRCELSIDANSSYTSGAYIYNTSGDMDWNLDLTYNADLYLKYKKCD